MTSTEGNKSTRTLTRLQNWYCKRLNSVSTLKQEQGTTPAFLLWGMSLNRNHTPCSQQKGNQTITVNSPSSQNQHTPVTVFIHGLVVSKSKQLHVLLPDLVKCRNTIVRKDQSGSQGRPNCSLTFLIASCWCRRGKVVQGTVSNRKVVSRSSEAFHRCWCRF